MDPINRKDPVRRMDVSSRVDPKHPLHLDSRVIPVNATSMMFSLPARRASRTRQRRSGHAPAPRPIVAPLAPERYRVQFTIGEQTEKKLRRLQQLLRREIPDGDPAVIFDKALDLLLARAENRKEGTVSIAERDGGRAPKAGKALTPGSRRVPSATRRTVVPRDGGQCTFIAASGRRCSARTYLEFHHAGVPFARGGGPGADNIALALPGPQRLGRTSRVRR